MTLHIDMDVEDGLKANPELPAYSLVVSISTDEKRDDAEPLSWEVDFIKNAYRLTNKIGPFFKQTKGIYSFKDFPERMLEVYKTKTVYMGKDLEEIYYAFIILPILFGKEEKIEKFFGFKVFSKDKELMDSFVNGPSFKKCVLEHAALCASYFDNFLTDAVVSFEFGEDAPVNVILQ